MIDTYPVSNTSPTVGVVIPFYNSNDTIGGTLKSVLEQSFQDFEIIICVDKNSSKLSLPCSDSRIKVVHNTGNPGAGSARFIAINETKCRYIAFIDADDEWVSTKLEEQISFMRNREIAFSFSGYTTIKNKQSVSIYCPEGTFNVERFLKKQITVCCSSVIIDRFTQIPIINANLRKRNDYQMWYPMIKFAINNNLNCGYLSKPLTIRNLHANNLTRNKLKLPYYNYKFYYQIFGSHSKSVFYSYWNIHFTIYTKIKSILVFGLRKQLGNVDSNDS